MSESNGASLDPPRARGINRGGPADGPDSGSASGAGGGAVSDGDRLAAILMITLGVATVGAFAGAVWTFSAVTQDRIIAEGWRMLAFPVFAGLFTLLGLFPRRMPGLWELVFCQKAGIAALVALLAPNVVGVTQSDNAHNVVLVDGTLAVVTLASYVLAKGWRAWTPGRFG